MLRLRYEWCRLPESNWRPTDYKSVALPTELSRHTKLCAIKLFYVNILSWHRINSNKTINTFKMVPRPGFEPGTRGFSILCSTN